MAYKIKYMMKTILLLAVLIPLQVFAGLPPTALKGQSGSNVTTFNFQVPHSQATQVSGPTSLIETGNQNILQNPGFEGTGDWTASGGATTAINTTAVGTGSKGYDWDSNSASQTLSSDSVTIPNGLKGKNGVVSCAIKTVSGTATHTIQAYDGTNILASTSITSDTGSFARTSLNFVFPTSGSAVLRLVSVASNEPEIYIDDCYMGLAEGFNIGSISQFGDWTSYTPTFTGFGTVTVQNFKYRTAPNGVEIEGRWTLGTTTATEARVSLPNVCAASASDYVTLESAGFGIIQINGRSLAPLIEPSVSYLTFGGIEASIPAIQKRNGNDLGSAGLVASIRAFVRCQGFSSNTVYRPEVSNVWGSTYWPDGTASFTTSSASYTAVTAASLLGTAVRTGQATACSDTDAICLKEANLSTGCYKVEYSGGAGADTNSQCSYSIYDGSSDYEIAASYNSAGSIFGVAGHSAVCYSSAQTNKEFTLRVKRVAGASTCQVNTTIGIGHNLTVTPLDQKMPAPVLVGGVTSNSTGAIRIEGASLAAPSGGACAVTEVGGSDWLNGNCTSSGTGICTCTLNSGVFSSAPICQISIANLAAANSRDEQITSTSTSTIVTFTATTGGTAVNNDVTIMCMGPR